MAQGELGGERALATAGSGVPTRDALIQFVHSRAFIPLVAAIFALPMALAPVLPLVDIGGHIGRYAIQLDAGRTPELAQWYTFKWALVPNLGADIVVQLTGWLLGVEGAARLAVVLTVALQASGILVLSRTIHGRITPWALVTLPLIYSWPFNFGFLNFSMSVGLALWGMVAWIRMENTSSARRWLLFATIALVLWTSHMVGWAIFCILAGSRELLRNMDGSKNAFETLRATTLAMSCMLVPLVIGSIFASESGEPGKTDTWFAFGWKLNQLMNVMLDRFIAFDHIALLFVLTFGIWGALIREVKVERSMALAFLILAILAALLPGRMLGSHYADIRLFPVAIMLGLLSLTPSSAMTQRMLGALLLVGLVFAGVRLGGTFLSSQETGRELAQELALIDELPQHAQLVLVHQKVCSATGSRGIVRESHLGGYAIARKHAFSNDQWQVQGGQLLTIHNPALAPFDRDPSQFDHTRACVHDFVDVVTSDSFPAAATHLWVVWEGDPEPLAGWKQMGEGHATILYRRDDG